MTSRERLLTVLRGEIPDCVPVAPDFSNMIPAKLTGKPWWDIYLYNDPPIFEAYVECAKKFDIDSLMDGYFPFQYPWQVEEEERFEQENPRYIVAETPEFIATQRRTPSGEWFKTIDVYWVNQTPALATAPANVGLPEIPASYRPLTGVKKFDRGPEGLKKLKERLGDQGLVGIWGASTCVINSPEALYHCVDQPEETPKIVEERIAEVERRMAYLRGLSPECRPDFICVGGSGSLILQTIEMVRELAFPAVRRCIELATKQGYFTHVHSCGPETALVKLLVENTALTVIDPLEIPPKGDCDLAELKRLYGARIVLKGNLHTTDVMLKGSVDDVVAASKAAIDAAKAGGRFILSTGDQCGRDTPFENLEAMVRTARTYGRY